MTYLLDTNIWIWLVESPEKLSARVGAITSDIENVPFGLSAISPWEVAKKVSLGKLALSLPVRDWMARAIRPPFIEIIPLSPEIALDANQLPAPFHNDPADQIIVATAARLHNLRLLTKDTPVLKYPHVQAIW